MAFSSSSSKAKAKASVNRLFESMLPGTSFLPSASGKASATENFVAQVSKKRLTKHERQKAQRVEKIKKNKAINKKLEQEKKFKKLVKFNVIKAHKEGKALSPEEQKYLRKLIKKNANAVSRVSEVDDPFVKDEIESLREEILALTNEKYERSRDRKLDAKLLSFNDKIKKGVLAYPGLTPGLAPVGFDDSDEE